MAACVYLYRSFPGYDALCSMLRGGTERERSRCSTVAPNANGFDDAQYTGMKGFAWLIVLRLSIGARIGC